MRFTLLTALAVLSSLLATPALAECRPTTQTYAALKRQGLEEEARAAAAPQGAERVNAYRRAAATFERALCARDQQGVPDHGIFIALGTVYLGAGDLVRADDYLQRGRRHANALDRTELGRLFAAFGYLSVLRGDNVAAREYFRRGAALRNPSAERSLSALSPPQAR